MQDIISKMTDTDIKPLVDPSPLQGTTVTIADGGTPPLDDTTYDLLLRVGTHPENHKLRHIINEPGPKYQTIYNHIVRELLNISPDGMMDNIITIHYWYTRQATTSDFSVRYFIMDLRCDKMIGYGHWRKME